MADNLYVHQGQASDPLLATKDTGVRHLPINLVGQHVRTYTGVQTLVLTGASQSLTLPALTTHADIQAVSTSSTDYCRFWDGGGTPTAAVGMTLGPGSPSGAFWESASPSSFKAINSSGSCTLQVAFFYYA